jgi:DNA-binding SARP family transcriptional activator/Flp pilus assembly protein TadD
MLGPLTISRDDVPVTLPASRKVRALLAYLSLSAHPVARPRLCELLWDVPNDPRGELRWSLSKIRGLIDEPDRRRVVTRADTVGFDLTDCLIDAGEIAHAMESIDTATPERLRALAALFAGEFLDGVEIEHGEAFNGWLTAQRRRFRGYHVTVLARLADAAADDEVLPYLEKWLELAPLDRQAHERLLRAFARQQLVWEGEDHLATAARLFEAEGLDCTPLRDAWRSARAREAAVVLSRDAESADAAAPRRASVAVMPFADASPAAGTGSATADALVHDVITRLAKLRSLFVIAQGSVFALHERHIGPREAARMLDVDYVASGSLRRDGARVTVIIELTDARTDRLVWSETLVRAFENVFDVVDEIGNSIVASIANEIEARERNLAILKPPNSLNAWEAHHRGLWHMYRFSKPDNERARHFFETAIRLDPTFARAYAGLSFTHFQNAFLGWASAEPQIERAYAAAAQSIMADDRDPAAHWAMGRALWLRRNNDDCVVELERAVDLSPNFALGYYTLAFVQAQAGDPDSAISHVDHSRQLSPYDPLLFGMLSSRALALVRLGRYDEAAEWSLRGAARPNAHVHILAIAALCLALAGRLEEGRVYLEMTRKSVAGYRVDDFLTAFHLAADAESVLRNAAKRLETSV